MGRKLDWISEKDMKANRPDPSKGTVKGHISQAERLYVERELCKIPIEKHGEWMRKNGYYIDLSEEEE